MSAKRNKIKYYSWVDIGSSFMMSELSASYLLPQIINHKKIFLFRKKLYLRYLKNFNGWLKDQFYLTNSSYCLSSKKNRINYTFHLNNS